MRILLADWQQARAITCQAGANPAVSAIWSGVEASEHMQSHALSCSSVWPVSDPPAVTVTPVLQVSDLPDLPTFRGWRRFIFARKSDPAVQKQKRTEENLRELQACVSQMLEDAYVSGDIRLYDDADNTEEILGELKNKGYVVEGSPCRVRTSADKPAGLCLQALTIYRVTAPY